MILKSLCLILVVAATQVYSNPADITILSSQVKCHACLDPLDTSPECICEAARCGLRYNSEDSTVLERFCSREAWSNQLYEDGCFSYQGQNYCFCSSDNCNAGNVSSIRGLDNCLINSCPNNSICFDTNESHKCICAPWDSNCQELQLKASCASGTCVRDCCSTLICYNGGYCTKDQYNQCKCNCPRGFTGPSCEVCDCCVDTVCEGRKKCVNNNGQCSCQCPAGTVEPYCCPPGTYGPNCDCDCCLTTTCQAPRTCRNNGQNQCTCECPPGRVEPYCCPPNTIGPTCITDCCKQTYCAPPRVCNNNNGQCTCTCPAGTVEPYCCPPGTIGPNCECDCCAVRPCKNGGTCVQQNGECSCICPAGFKKPACDPCTTGSSTGGGCRDGKCGLNQVYPFGGF